MNLLSSFSDFYSNLSSDGLFFFWIIIFLFFFLTFLSIILILKNKKLSRLLKEEKKEEPLIESIEELPVNEEIQENTEKLFTAPRWTEYQDVKPLNIYVPPTEEDKNKIEEFRKHIDEEIKKETTEETGPYKKNILREMNARMQTSPINIEKKDMVVKEPLNYNISNIDSREDSLSPFETMEDSYEINDNMKFASEIVERMEEEIKPSNIELTDYEKKQEEEAIISYDELLKIKDKIYNLTEEEETDEFIDELKSFRLDLQ